MKNNPPPQKTKSESSGLNKRHPVLASILLGLAILMMPVALQAATPASPSAVETAVKARLVETYGKLPLSFEQNQGQTGEEVRFLSRGPGYTVFLTPTEAVLSLHKPEQPPLPSREKSSDSMSTASTALRIKLVGANPKPHVSGVDALPGKVNYFRGNKSNQWRTNIPTYAKVKQEQVYPGIDLVYYGNQRQLEHDFIIAPGADPKTIRLAFSGINKLAIDPRGDLLVQVAGGEVRLAQPVIYQEIDGKRHEIEGRYVLHHGKGQAHARVGFQVANYDRDRPLVIDPVLGYSTFLGGTGFDFATSIAVDGAGDVYVTGVTTSIDFPATSGAFDTSHNGGSHSQDVFVTKLNGSGSSFIYSTYLGGGDNETGLGMAIDSAGNAYVTGVTFSSDFPSTPGTFDATRDGDRDCFVTKLNQSGGALVYSTYLGGSAFEYCYSIAVDSGDNAYVTGSTTRGTPIPFPTTAGAYDITYNSGTPAGDGFITKFNATGSALIYSTFLGGIRGDYGLGITLDGAGNAYVTGATGSDNFPTTSGAFDGTFNGFNSDAFVAKLNASGSALLYSTYLGGAATDEGTSIVVDGFGNAYVTGWTHSTNFPTSPGAFDPNNTGSNPADGFITKLNATGAVLLYSTFLGGTSHECGGGIFNATGCHIAVDSLGNAYVTGPTQSSDFPTTAGALDTTHNGNADAFLTQFNANGTGLLYSTFLGSTSSDISTGIALDTLGNVYLAGTTRQAFSPPFFPTTPGAYDTSFNGSWDVFLAKISDTASPPPAGGTVYLLLHGTASDPRTWDELVGHRFGGHCPVTELGQDLTEDSVCYRVEFADIPIGDIWKNGDGSKFDQLGVEVGVAIRKIEARMQPAAIILVGHSRGGLAARAYLQSITQPPPFKLGLLTIGTPHQGTPLGRVKHWMDRNGYDAGDVPATVLSAICLLPGTPPPAECVYRFKAILFSPSAGYQATSHNRAGKPVLTNSSAAIHALNAGADRLDDWVLTFGQLYSHNFRLAQNIIGPVDLLDNGSLLGRWLVDGRFRKLRRSVLKNIVSRIKLTGASFCVKADRTINNWACNGDGVVPTISQRLTRLPGFSRGSKPLHSASVKGVSHVSETGRIVEINNVLNAMENDLR